MAATNSVFRTETRDEHLYNHIELFNRSSSPIDASAANRCQDCRGQHPTENQIATGRRMFGDYRTEPSNEHLYYNIQSINKPSSPATESQGANQTSQDDRRRQQPTGNSKTMVRLVASAMIAVLALTFLAMVASLIATNWVHAEKSGTKSGGRVLDGMQQQLKEVKNTISLLVDKNLASDMVAKTIDQVSSNQIEGRRLLETKIENQTLELNQVISAGCQDCRILNDVKQQLKEALENLNDTVAKIIDKVSSNQTEERRLLEKKIEKQILVLKDSKDNQTKQFEQAIKNHTLELKQEIKISIENQTRERQLLVNEINHLTSEFEDLAARVNQTDEGPWIKMNESPICFGATDNNARSFKVPSSGTLASVKLVHLDGYVRCHYGNWSFWGCGQNPKVDVNVEIRNSSGSPILPSREFVTLKETSKMEFLRIPGYNTLSPELVLSADVSNPPNVTQGQWLSLYHRYGSSSSCEGHKGGKSCCDVYARFL